MLRVPSMQLTAVNKGACADYSSSARSHVLNARPVELKGPSDPPRRSGDVQLLRAKRQPFFQSKWLVATADVQ